MSPLVAVFLEGALAYGDVFDSNTCYCVNSVSQTPSVLSVHNVTVARLKKHVDIMCQQRYILLPKRHKQARPGIVTLRSGAKFQWQKPVKRNFVNVNFVTDSSNSRTNEVRPRTSVVIMR
jgi:hypothetical protein